MANDTTAAGGSLIGEVLSILGPDPVGKPGRTLFAELLLASTDAASLAEVDRRLLAAEVNAAFAALRRKPPGRHAVRLRDETLMAGEGKAPVTVLEIVNDDRPFLLDSVLAELQARNHQIHFVVHPIFKTRRTADGVLEEVTAPGDSNWADGHQESYIGIVLERLPAEEWPAAAEAVSLLLDQVRDVVEDWRPMLARTQAATADLEAVTTVPGDLQPEAVAFLKWLTAGNFTFLGVRDYALHGDSETGELVPVDGAGLGILRDPSVYVLRRGSELVAMTPEVRRFFFEPNPLIITKSNVVARVHRRVHMDYIGVKRYAADGTVTGEVRVVGLFTSSGYTQSPRQIPVLRHKIAAAVAAHGAPPESHAGKALINVMETFPRDELFQIGLEDLERWSVGILDLDIRPRVRVFARTDRFDRFVSVLVFAPRDRFSTTVRERIAAHLASVFDGRIVAFEPRFSDTPLVRVHFIVGRYEGATPVVPEIELERAIIAIARTWEDKLAYAFRRQGETQKMLAARYGHSFPAGYAEIFPPERAVQDALRIERLGPDKPMAIDLYRDPGMPENRVRAAIYRFGEPIRLSERVPVLENLGFSAIDERSFRISPQGARVAGEVVLHDMMLETVDGSGLDIGRAEARLEDCYLSVLGGQTENDNFNRLVLAADATWREAAMLRAYAAYLRQLGSGFGVRYIAETLARHAGVSRDIVDLFHTRLAPGIAKAMDTRAQIEAQIRERIEGALAKVQSLDEDRILRQMLGLVLATVRTNFHLTGKGGVPPATIAFKLDGQALDMAPAPRPYREMWVWSPRVEGVHMRFAPIARGGIRWSDRAQDFRTEVLGLAKAQHVKNAVIVPAGAKGGFYPKQLPRGGTREAVQKEGIEAYKIFVSAMLDLTDNIQDGAIVPPKGLVRHDGEDPYLVVAADKGTATFSDTANGLSAEHHFWLDDAFASGGSAGYDHKGIGITARGAWECVKRHFREMDRDIQVEPFRVVGVGDMSGDVFGNGMLLSHQTRLVAAFDHRDIFLDPDPDPAASWGERKRLFGLPRSSWADYDRNLISKGGGVYSRAAKSIALSDEVRAMLGVDAYSLAPNELLNAILKCEADLLWFGGIGTYVRATTQTDLDVGDRGNDAIRITAADIRAAVIGEGANLGMTQRARIEAATRGIRLNTDFIDNSAGVNTSDQEVNIKIALGPVVAGGRMTLIERNVLLSAMTEDVAAAVLRNNYQQSLALSLAEREGHAGLGTHASLIRNLESRGLLDRALEALPSDAEIAERDKTGRGFVRPELAVLSSYAKITLLHDLLASKVPEDPYLEGLLIDYFPPALRSAHAGDLKAHRLRREIIATTLTNGLVNRLGAPTPQRLAGETSRSVGDVAYAFMAARAVLGLADIWTAVDGLDGHMRGADQLALYERLREVAVRTTAFFARDGRASGDLAATVARHRAGLESLEASFAGMAPEAALAARAAHVAKLEAAGTPPDVAGRIAGLVALADAPRMVALSEATGRPVAAAARAWLEIGERFGIGDLAARARQTRAADDYDRLAISGALGMLGEAHRGLAAAALAAGADASGLGPWASRHADRIAAAEQDLAAIAGAGALSISRLSVAAGRLTDLARDTAA